jgi:hypothetical protein
MIDERHIEITFEGLATSEKNTAVTELSELLAGVAVKSGNLDKMSLSVKKESETTQDFGATLVIVLGTPAALAIAKGVHDFISKRGSKVVIRIPGGEVIATGDAAQNIDVAKTAQAIVGSSLPDPH